MMLHVFMYVYFVFYISSEEGGWETRAMVAQVAQGCFVSHRRGAIVRGRTAVEAWRQERNSYFRIEAVLGIGFTGFLFGWISCFIWLLLPTLVYEH